MVLVSVSEHDNPFCELRCSSHTLEVTVSECDPVAFSAVTRRRPHLRCLILKVLHPCRKETPPAPTSGHPSPTPAPWQPLPHPLSVQGFASSGHFPYAESCSRWPFRVHLCSAVCTSPPVNGRDRLVTPHFPSGQQPSIQWTRQPPLRSGQRTDWVVSVRVLASTESAAVDTDARAPACTLCSCLWGPHLRGQLPDAVLTPCPPLPGAAGLPLPPFEPLPLPASRECGGSPVSTSSPALVTACFWRISVLGGEGRP